MVYHIFTVVNVPSLYNQKTNLVYQKNVFFWGEGIHNVMTKVQTILGMI